MPARGVGPSYRDELTAAYERIAALEARNHELTAALARRDHETVTLEHVRDLDATLQRWDRVRATLAMLLGFTGLFALRIAEHWSVRAALLSSCAAMVAVGVTLAWPRTVRGRVDPRPHARDVSRPWRRRKTRGDGAARVRVEATTTASEPPASGAELAADVDDDAEGQRARG